MTDPFMMKDTPWYAWQKVVSALVLAAVVVLAIGWSSGGLLERRGATLALISAIIGVAIIWFPDAFEDYEHLSGQSLLEKVKPVKYEVSIGWLYLLCPFVVLLVTKFV